MVKGKCVGKILNELSILKTMENCRYLYEILTDLEMCCRDSVDEELGVCDLVDQIICSHVQVGLSNWPVYREGLGGGLFHRPDPIVNNPFLAKNLTDCVEMRVRTTNSTEIKKPRLRLY